MSSILKALRRLEQERAKGGERPLREEVVLARPRRRGPWAARVVTGAALAAGFAATWLVFGSLGEPARPPEAQPAAAAPAAPTPGAVAAPPPAAPPTVRVAAGASAPAPAPAPEAVAAPAPAPEGEPLRPVAPVRRPAAPAPTPPRVAVAPPAPVAPVEPVLGAPIVGRAPRFVDEDAVAPRAPDVPVDVVRTSWHPMADRRSAWVAIGDESPREVREGEWVGAYEVRSIEPDGVLFADGPLLVHRPVGE